MKTILATHIINSSKHTLSGTHTSTLALDTPLVLSVPHGGMYVLDQFTDRFNYGPGFWVDVDMYTDKVYPTNLGSSIVAQLAPQQVNMNRSWQEWLETGEKDPIDMQSLLAGEIILRRPYAEEEREYLHTIWTAYHAELEGLIRAVKERWGYVLLIDCHSLNSRALANVPDAGLNKERAHFVIGSLDDTSADARIIGSFERALGDATREFDYRVVRNDPYKGGYITKRYHNPSERIHVLQLEIQKAMYMHEGLDDEEDHAFEPKPSLPTVTQILHDAFAQTLAETRRVFG
jgi:N-formylglutamate amidohydrolase